MHLATKLYNLAVMLSIISLAAWWVLKCFATLYSDIGYPFLFPLLVGCYITVVTYLATKLYSLAAMPSTISLAARWVLKCFATLYSLAVSEYAYSLDVSNCDSKEYLTICFAYSIAKLRYVLYLIKLYSGTVNLTRNLLIGLLSNFTISKQRVWSGSVGNIQRTCFIF